ncbi:hypothetical protein ECHHL_0760 [Ehrlichia chaffeensis str. Heartland]|uniref:Uncharacterized protein n=1 Tax=Ehrlichia chaffeensis (strain ATCC CRL-10679 / Arkansas) TaxID=205920 RepID=Q2GFX9_EHRCR|nr:hypothetical protein ECH_0859 [Ehrlichia chaffeensis str. Arkansas]AHX03905.1 hypothetical protein ECHHL_0760 [Ehrlichia chaffeensis str. Heartland]AHX05366.1 hypothetical protein ECHJAX_0289 [Ehrlichia chaffeensis str. Jax]AHX06353.1 hypothetical protein ECHLIB_0285 [Ehrlichia chaffeensis str. Liberty]AHX08561.1 hypothetical protein ECHSTV_0280 [Ehrlichia chaffeensis str. Saint Vincent]AHX09448.1 hypothetical protein ECHWAK_0286 [Ehrlichia chaffeensis str. Wakulla]AHX10125.1 hypothetical 
MCNTNTWCGCIAGGTAHFGLYDVFSSNVSWLFLETIT